jgi:hypothetical protein
MMLDFVVSNLGSVAMVRPVSDDAKIWVDENVALESWQWMGDAFAVEPRYLPHLIEGIQENGFEVA